MGISLKILGNKRTNEGIGNDLVSIGDNRFAVTDDQYPGTKGVTDFIVIRHLPDKSIYTVVTKNVTPCDSDRKGTLYISVAVPVKEHVEGLFNLLIELQNAYKSTCMTYDGTMYHFLARNDMPQPFEEILARHKVDRYPYKPVVTADDLSAKAYLFMTPEQISDILDDPMRGEFSRFGEVVLVPVADPSQYVSTINIPAKIWRSYKIFVNGRQTGQVLSDPTKVVTITLPETSTHKPVSVTFSIAQARDTRMPGIAIDDEAQIIYLNMKPELKPVPVNPRPDHHDHDRHAGGGGKKTVIVAAVTAVIVLAIAAAVYFFVLAPSDSVDNKNPADKVENKDGKDTKVDKKDNDVKILDDEDMDEEDFEEVDEVQDAIAPNPFDDAADMRGDEGADKTQKDKGKDTPIAPKEPKSQKDPLEEVRLKYQEFIKVMNQPENYNFKNLKSKIRYRTNYYEFEDYSRYGERAELVSEVIDYISSLGDGNVDNKDYNNKIQDFINRANALGLPGLAKILKERIKNPAAIQKSMLNKDSF